jgi:hypothetical protein
MKASQKEKFEFYTDCVSLDSNSGHYIRDMVDSSEKITYETFLRNVNREEFYRMEKALGYGNDIGLRMKKDWAVSFFKGIFRGKPCYYFDWSRIEHIFLRIDDINDLDHEDYQNSFGITKEDAISLNEKREDAANAMILDLLEW